MKTKALGLFIVLVTLIMPIMQALTGARIVSALAVDGIIPSGAIHIQTATQLAAIGGVDSAGKYYVLDNDITLTSAWVPIDDFRGTFDGQGYSINNLYVLPSYAGDAGLFGYIGVPWLSPEEADTLVRKVTIKNLTVHIGPQGIASASYDAGGLIGSWWGGDNLHCTLMIENSHTAGNISSSNNVGGLIGCAHRGVLSITKCSTTGNVSCLPGAYDHYNAGGLVGTCNTWKTKITDCYTRGNVTGCYYAGGLVGLYRADVIIRNCCATGNVYAVGSPSMPPPDHPADAGGLIGHGLGGVSLQNCYRLSTQSVTGYRVNSLGTSLTPAQMKQQSSFVGWDFNTVWSIDPNINDGYPCFPKKAIYILPGYMGSELYDDFGRNRKVWFDLGTTMTFPWDMADKLKFIQNLNGDPGVLGVNQEKDSYGARDHYKELVNRLTEEFSGEYDVIFWPYNWLADLNDSLTILDNDINKNGYTDIVFVTHSTGGLLASAYISKDDAHKQKVKAAVLIAAPLFGTYASLFPIERGDAAKLLEQLWTLDFVGALADALTWNTWIMDWAHNSPTTYQLLPSTEYLQHYPLELDLGSHGGRLSVTTAFGFYYVLNRSEQINPILTNGGPRSHGAFRETTLKGNVVDQLQGVDVLLIGTAYGYPTPYVAEYTSTGIGSDVALFDDISYSRKGDGTVQCISASATSKMATELPKNFKFSSKHSDLVKDDDVITAVCEKIAAGPSKGGGGGRGGFSMAAVPLSVDVGMSEQIKIRYTCDLPVNAVIYDAARNVVARANGSTYEGFDGDDFIYDNFADDELTTKASIYLPNYGNKVVFSYGDTASVAVDFASEVSTLVPDGWKEASATHVANVTVEDGVIAVFDWTTEALLSENIGAIVDGEVLRRYTDWDLQDELRMNLHDTQSMPIVGSEAAEAAPLLSWSTSDDSIVSVADDGVLTAEGYGRATIAATDGNKPSTCLVTVIQDATSISLDDIDMVIGERTLIRPQFTPSTATETDMTYSISTDGIIEINESGVILALTPGTVTVTGATSYGVQDAFTVNVIGNSVIAVQSMEITPDSASISKGASTTFNAVIMPENATDTLMDWYVDDEEVISLAVGEGSATVTGLKEGTTEVIAISTYGGYVAKATVTVTAVPSPAKDITDFTINGVDGVISGTSIALTLPYGTDVTNLTPSITHTGASISPASGAAHNFTNPVQYTVTAADTTTNVYTVTVTVVPSPAKDITDFTINGVDGVISGTGIALILPHGTDITNLTPSITHTGTSVSPASGAAQNFTNPVQYTVTAADTTTNVYTVTVTVAPSPAKDITAFTINGVDGVISGTDIAVTLPYGTDVTDLTPSITHTGANVSPASGTAQNFTNPVQYTVTAADTTTSVYTVTVTVAISTVPPSIITTAPANGTVGAAYSHILTVTGDAPITWDIASGALPSGLTLSAEGVIAGIPTKAGTYGFAVSATNSAGSDLLDLSITIGATASIGNIIISGRIGSALGGGQGALITLTGDTVAGALVNVDASDWFTSTSAGAAPVPSLRGFPGFPFGIAAASASGLSTGLPTGLTVTANAAVGSSTIALTFDGTPLIAFSRPFSITIPGKVLASGRAVTVTGNFNARFNIIGAMPPSDLPKTGDGFPMGVLLTLLGITMGAISLLGFRMWKQKKQA